MLPMPARYLMPEKQRQPKAIMFLKVYFGETDLLHQGILNNKNTERYVVGKSCN